MTSRAAIPLLAAAGLLLLLILALTVTDSWGWVALVGLGLLVGEGLLLRSRTGRRLFRQLLRRVRRVPLAHSAVRPSPRLRPVAGGSPPAGLVLDQLKALTPAQFEEFSRLLLLAAGYRDVQRVGGSGDQGVDLRMADPVGNLCVVQCKRYAGSVSPAVVRELYGVMARTGAREAYLLTTGRVSAAAQAWIGDKPLRVWPADRLVRYAEQYLGDHLPTAIQAARRAV